MATVGLIANPVAGSDMRRLAGPAGHTSHAAKVDIMRRVAVAARSAGADRVVVANDAAGLGRRVAQMCDLEVLTDEPTGSRLDTVAAARRMWKEECGAVVALGGDGTCRDVAVGWPDVPLVALSTGTNNVYPQALDAGAAGSAAGFVAAGSVPLEAVARPSKRLVVHVGDAEHIALVDLAVLRGAAVGARSVLQAGAVRAVVAAISTPLASGLSSIAGRVCPLDADDPDAVIVHLAHPSDSARIEGFVVGGQPDNPRSVRVGVVPGVVEVVRVASVERLRRGSVARFAGPAVLAFDGERDVVVPAGITVSVTVDGGGPRRIDVGRALLLAVQRRAFDVQLGDVDGRESTEGD